MAARRFVFVVLMAAWLGGLPTAALASERLGVVNVLAPLSPDPSNDSAVLTTALVGAGGFTGEPYQGVILGDTVRTSDLLPAVSSAEPTDLAADPASGSARQLVWSHCPGDDAHGSPTCPLQTSTQGSSPVAMEETPAGRQDRMPAIYRGAVAFARRSVQHPDQLHFLAADSDRSVHLHGATGRWGAARISGLALRGRTLAYVWRTQPPAGKGADVLQLQRVGGRPETVLTIPATGGHLIGPTWDGGQFSSGSGGTAPRQARSIATCHAASTTRRRLAPLA
ncbi:MAG: hypothetical protein JWM31_1509 [Solirubrobacterales bacterium]|nr:hypothetical protein [Solirubrobacterales bacterium]